MYSYKDRIRAVKLFIKLDNTPRHNSCRFLRNQEHGGGDEGQ